MKDDQSEFKRGSFLTSPSLAGNPLINNPVMASQVSRGFDRLWALGRAVEGMNYYDLLEIVGLERIKRDWSSLKPTLRNKTRIKGIEYLLLKWNQLPLV